MDTAANIMDKAAPRDARQLRSQAALNAAMLSLLETKPFDQISIRDISAEAGTGYATFFRHYPSKEALLNDVASAEIAGLLALTMPLLQDVNSFESTKAVCHHVAAHRKLWTALLTGGAASIVRTEFIRQAHFLPQNIEPSNGWLPEDLGVSYGTGSTIDVLAWWLEKGDAYSTDQIAAILNRLVIAPLVGRMAAVPDE